MSIDPKQMYANPVISRNKVAWAQVSGGGAVSGSAASRERPAHVSRSVCGASERVVPETPVLFAPRVRRRALPYTSLLARQVLVLTKR